MKELERDKDGDYIIPVGKTVYCSMDYKTSEQKMYFGATLYEIKDPWYKRLINWIRR